MQDIKTQNQTIVSDEVKHLELSFFVQYTAYTLLQDHKSEQEKKVYISTGKKSNTTYLSWATSQLFPTTQLL